MHHCLNNGMLQTISQMGYLFEPFLALSKSGHGLGLWVTCQTVPQPVWKIGVTCHNGHIRLSISPPMGEPT
jgi:nitrogen-specific signal transduction histidine kinase